MSKQEVIFWGSYALWGLFCYWIGFGSGNRKAMEQVTAQQAQIELQKAYQESLRRFNMTGGHYE